MKSDPSDHGRLIDGLAQDLRPVMRLAPPGRRAGMWIALLTAVAIVLAELGDVSALGQRIAAVPDVGWAMLGSGLTAVLAAIAAFQTSVPGRATLWNLLPLPALLFWVASSGLGCLSAAAGGIGKPASLYSALEECLPFLLLVSLPLLAVLLFMLRRGFPPQPAHTAAQSGLAAAAGAATLLNFFHPFDVAAIDLTVHGLAVVGIAVLSRAFGQRFLGGQSFPGGPRFPDGESAGA
jgi:hypothetical protein